MAGGFGGFVQGLGIAYGRNLMVGQDMAEKQSLIDERNTQTAQARAQMAMLAKQQETQKEVGDYVNSEVQKDASTITDPQKSAQLFTSAAGIALRSGDFTSAGKLGDLAKQKLQEAKEAAAYTAQQQQVKKEDLANTASDFAANPTAEGLQNLITKAVAAGVNPTTIPRDPKSPQFAAWVNQQQLASKSASEKADYQEKIREFSDRQQEKKDEFQARMDDRREGRAQSAILREAMIGIQQSNLAIRQQELDLRKETAANGGKQGVQQQRDTAAIAGAAAEGARNLRQITNFQIGTTGSPFTGLTDHNIIDALAKTSTNAVTPETMQMFQTAGAGLAQQVGRVETLGGGRGVNQTQINQLEKQLTPVPGDHPLTQLYKVATGAELLLTRMENTPPPRDAKMAEKWQQTMDELGKYPKPEQILAKAQGKTKSNILDLEGSYSDNLARIHATQDAIATSPVSSAAPAGASVPGLPAGWSVKEK